MGLSDKEKAICDMFVFIPQYGQGTASLNVSVAAGIILHHYALWAGYHEQQRQDDKFVVEDAAAVSHSAKPQVVSLAVRERAAAAEESLAGFETIAEI